MAQKAPPVTLSEADREQLTHLARCGSEEQRVVTRALIVLGAADGKANKELERTLKVSRTTVAFWRKRFPLRRIEKPTAPVRELLADASRVGAPARIQPEQWVDILVLVTTRPEDEGIPETHWSSATLAAKAIEKGFVKSVDRSTISRFLAECDLKPHRVVGWMNRKKDTDFDERATKVKNLLCEAVAPGADPVHVVGSFDEKTGMQATERIAPDKPMQPGRPLKREYEYERHGTRVLLAMLIVGTGHVMGALMGTRTNEDTVLVFRTLLAALFAQGNARMTIILDQLNTHMSELMVGLVAELSGVPLPDQSVMCTRKTRRAWLEETGRSVTFCFTPRHASWLNPIETWFGVLSRKVLRRGSFASVEELDLRILNFLEYYNRKLAHPYRYKQHRRREDLAAAA